MDDQEPAVQPARARRGLIASIPARAAAAARSNVPAGSSTTGSVR
jgi:hypothetical protein